MSVWLLPAISALGVLLIVVPKPAPRLVNRVGIYLEPVQMPSPAGRDEAGSVRLSKAGLPWTLAEWRVRNVMAAMAGMMLGILVAQGDAFITGPERSTVGLSLTGAFAGVLFLRMWITRREEHRRQQLKEELPLLADAFALQIMAGESVIQAVERLVYQGVGVGPSELACALERYRGGESLTESLERAAVETVQPEARRLYELLATGHHTGGRLARDLMELSRDYRATLERELIAEGGRRAIAVYAPILALMIPVTLVFLVYPALAGLRELAQQ